MSKNSVHRKGRGRHQVLYHDIFLDGAGGNELFGISLTPVQTPAKLPVSLMTVLAGTGVAEYTVAMMRTSIFGF